MKQLLACALSLAISFSASAQKRDGLRTPMTAEQRAEKKTTQMAQKLNLAPEQRDAMARVNLESARKMQPHMDGIRAERKAMRAISKERNAEYKNILTPEQLQTLREGHAAKQRQTGREGGKMNRLQRSSEATAPAYDR